MKIGKILATENKFGKNKASLSSNYAIELEKDTWDVRNIGIPYDITRSEYSISFSGINENFKSLVKRYVVDRVINNDSIRWKSAILEVSKLRRFFNFLNTLYPNWKDLRNLSREDIESYIEFIKTNSMGGNSKSSQYKDKEPTDNYIWSMIANLETFLYYIQRYEWIEAPIKPIRVLIYQEDRPKLKPRKISDYKYMTDNVWKQIDENIEKMDSQYVPMILIMKATGFQLVDVLNLKIDSLIENIDGFWIISERVKTKKVPIDDEIVELVKAQIEFIKENFSGEQNKERFLFMRYKGKKNWRGQPYLELSLWRQLNTFSLKCNITDDEGNIFRFGSIAFRHHFGISQINNGASILDVQRLLSNVTPQMAVIYAKINDYRQQLEWNKSFQLEAIRLDPISGEVMKSNIEEQAVSNGLKLEWLRKNLWELRLDHGYCIKSIKTPCQYVNQIMEQPCITFKCSSFYVDSTFSDYYDEQIIDIRNRIKDCEKSGRVRLIEILEPKLRKYIEIKSNLI